MKIFSVDELNPSNITECAAAKNLFQPTEEEQGEVCFRGRLMMMGYLANPDLGADHVKQIKKKTDEAIDGNGRLRARLAADAT